VPRGDVVIATGAGYASKPRPCVILQADEFDATDSVTVCLLTNTEADAPDIRIRIEPSDANGLKAPSWAMADRIMTLRRTNINQAIGRLSDDEMALLARTIIVFLKLA
jgi:mRNA interferase MazF